MRFTQKEKVADQIAEKAAILLTKCDPNVLNTVINEIVPRPISHEENGKIRRYLLGIADEIQTYSNVIKMLSYSIFDSEEMLRKLEKVWNEKVYEANNTVMVHIRRLRGKMKEDERQDKIITTVWGVGYKIEK